MGHSDAESDRRASVGRLSSHSEAEHPTSRYARVREHIYALGGVCCKTFTAADSRYELEVWTTDNTIFIVQHWLDDGGVDVYAPVTSSLRMSDLLAAIR